MLETEFSIVNAFISLSHFFFVCHDSVAVYLESQWIISEQIWLIMWHTHTLQARPISFEFEWERVCCKWQLPVITGEAIIAISIHRIKRRRHTLERSLSFFFWKKMSPFLSFFLLSAAQNTFWELIMWIINKLWCPKWANSLNPPLENAPT